MKKNAGFQKFFKGGAPTGAKKKEAIRQEKREVGKEREEGIAAAKRFKRAQHKQGTPGQPPKYNQQPPGSQGYRKPQASNTANPTSKSGYAKSSADKPFKKRFEPQKGKPSSRKGDVSESLQARQQRFTPQKASRYKAGAPQERRGDDQTRTPVNRQQRFTPKKPSQNNDPRQGQRKFEPKPGNVPKNGQPQRGNKPYGRSRQGSQRERSRFDSPRPERPPSERPRLERTPEPAPRPAGIKAPTTGNKELMPLNKYIAHGGLCSRREAVDYIKGGKVKVNSELIPEPGYKVSVNDDVRVGGRKMNPVKDFVYILLNKPKDYITTTDDPQERKTVLDLVSGATESRIYPVGRLDRNTSGVLLLTNDGDLSQNLTHPSNEITKVYAVTLDKPLTKIHFQEILKGVQLEDGPAYVDSLAYTDTKDATQIGVEIHTGRNRIVRRIFEHFGYDVKALDRVVFAGLTKKNVNRGKWRHLTEKEVRDLKFFKKGRK